LAALPAQFGFDNASEFVAVVLAATGGKLKLKREAKKKGANKSRAVRRRHALITDETWAEVRKLFEAGKTGSEIAKALKISLPSVANIKKAQGLVKKRGRGGREGDRVRRPRKRSDVPSAAAIRDRDPLRLPAIISDFRRNCP
jgi:hypothetical protein